MTFGEDSSNNGRERLFPFNFQRVHVVGKNCLVDNVDVAGIWFNNKKNFLLWINEEDHLRVISMEKGGDMGAVFKRFCEGLVKFEGAMKQKGEKFMHNDHLGYVLTCPSNLGTGLRAGVHVKLPNLAKVGSKWGKNLYKNINIIVKSCLFNWVFSYHKVHIFYPMRARNERYCSSSSCHRESTEAQGISDKDGKLIFNI